MPNNYDFSTVENIRSVEVKPTGWKLPVVIEYGVGFENVPVYCWKVNGTTHTFIIPVIRLDYLSEGDYASHFSKVLEDFREEYLEWQRDGWRTDWSQEYRTQYSRFINNDI